MQKVLRRSALAERQAARRTQNYKSRIRSVKRKEAELETRAQQKILHGNLKAARLARREDWLLGPLAPKRDVGHQKGTFGTIDARALRGGAIPEEKRTKRWPIREGDRVVLLEGRDKGKIGTVKTCDKEREEAIVDGLNKVW